MTCLSNLRSLRRTYKPTLSTWQTHRQNARINVLGRSGDLIAARKLFDEMPNRDLVSWNSILTAHWRNRDLEGCKCVFDSMPVKDVLSWNSFITGCVENGDVDMGFEYFMRMPERNVASWNAMVSGFVRHGRISEAECLFLQMGEKNVISYTCMVDGYMRNKEVKKARNLFDEMPNRNEVSWAVMISGYVENQMFQQAMELFDKMPNKNLISCTAMITCYSEQGKVVQARRTFDLIRVRDTVSWNAMLTGYIQNGYNEDGLKLYIQMVQACTKPDHATLICALTATSSLAFFQQGRVIHATAIKTLLNSYNSFCNSLITMYSKCGSITDSEFIFREMRNKETVSYNTIIQAYSQHGNYEKVLEFFHQMEIDNIIPDGITFLSLLSACGHVGKIKDSLKYFDLMKSKYNITPQEEHYSCIVVILNRAGEIKKATKYMKTMSSNNEKTIWGSLLNACKLYQNVELGKIAAQKIVQLDDKSSGSYVMLSNIYATAGMWKEVNEVRNLMRERGVRKMCGFSWVEIRNKVHYFSARDVSHPESENIFGEIEKIGIHMKSKEQEFNFLLDWCE